MLRVSLKFHPRELLHPKCLYYHLLQNVSIFVNVSDQTRLDTRSKAQRPIKVGIKGRGGSGKSRDSNPAGLCCSSAHLVQCEPDEASSFTNPNMGPRMYASLRLKLDARSSAILLYFDPRPGPKMLFQGDTPEGSDTFQWPVIERDRVGGLRRMIWDKV